ncbi:hypothetical protein FSP39_022291 [Pinctada imbricata]|uniref:Uncharacterized protein n=1 Tax=Pinctada imbricata TaxID=66713 RepID=A0AA88XPD6_PINIB|nr:hypothetical protein FSP39_022291 [Pinctada imbricata]
MKTRFWPDNKKYEIFSVDEPFYNTLIKQKLNGLNLQSGAKYSIHVTALNQATMSSSHESEGVIVDTTSPKINEVRMCKPLEDEELSEDGRQVLHDDPESLTISWRGRDSESGIVNIYVGLGRSPGSLSETGGEFLKFAGEETLVLKNLNLDITSKTNKTYYVTLKAKNGAGLNSSEIYSKEIYVQKANVPGTVYDSRDEFVDNDYMFDKTSIAMTFGGFESEACNIVGYEWAVGTQPYYSDVLPYTDYGVVMLNATHGQGQIHLQLYEDMTYYISVRAQTGHNCGKGKEYIVSCSDGIKVDSKEPVVRNIGPTANNTRYIDYNGVFYQSYVDSLDLAWNISDASPVAETSWSVGSQPYKSDIKDTAVTLENRLPPGSVTLTPGSSVFLNIQSTDDAGNTVYTVSQPVIADLSSPVIHGFTCTEYISTAKTSVTCTWESVEENESVLEEISIDVSSDQVSQDLAGAMPVHKGHRKWTRDFSHLIANNTKLNQMYVTVHARNVLGLEGVAAYGIVVDHSPPSEGKLDFVTRTDDKDLLDVQKCQIPWMYAEINIHSLIDVESGIDRVEIALGYAPEQSDIQKFELVNHTAKVFIDHLSLRHGTQVYATARVYNKAGLYNLFTSDAVAISPSPKLTVTDGDVRGKDSDYQSKLNVIQGYWEYSDACPILKAEYMIEDLTGKVIQDYQLVPGNGRFFYNDELTLKNGYMYIVHVRVTDALYRTLSARSDGITVRIQTPNPGLVIDGLVEDFNYQQSTTGIVCKLARIRET